MNKNKLSSYEAIQGVVGRSDSHDIHLHIYYTDKYNQANCVHGCNVARYYQCIVCSHCGATPLQYT